MIQIRYIVALSILLITPLLLFTQTPSKLGLELRNIAQKNWKEPRMVSLFVEGDTSGIKRAVKTANGHFKYTYGNISSVTVPASQLMDFSRNPAIENIENAEREMQPLADEAIRNNNILPVQQGQTPLEQEYKGKDVVMGIIDAGIDFSHPDFKDASGNTRIQYIWDQNKSSSNSPQPYDYGTEWTKQQIDNGNCNHNEPSNQFGHGTNVAGVAAGDGSAVGKYKGMAPKSTIIVVAFDYSRPFISTFIDAADYIFKKADAMGKPCVVNASLGTYYGARDGKDMGSRMVNRMLEERNGRALVAAGGNAGHINYHLSYDVTEDSSFTWFSANNEVAFQFWADTSDFDNVKFAVGADDTSNGHEYLGRTEYLSLEDDYNLKNDGDGTFQTFNLYHKGSFVGEIQTFAELEDGVYFWEASISPSNANYLWRLQTKGEGTFDLWSHPSLISGSARIVEDVPPQSLVPSIDRYKFPDNRKTTVSSFTCSDKVITVGNYYNRESYIDYNNDTVVLPGHKKGEIVKKSSRGPTRDGRIKPDITASGSTIITTGNLDNINLLLNNGQAFKVAPGGMHSRNDGTSLAAPNVSGLVALYFQKNPRASYRHVQDAITRSAKTDSFTSSNIPNNTWGYGKLDGFAAMNETIIYGCTDSTAFNYDSSATVDDGSCEDVVVGCMDSTAVNYNPEANVSNDSCVYDTTGIVSFDKRVEVAVYPNPLKNRTVFNYDLTRMPQGEGRIILTDILGEQLKQLAIDDRKGSTVLMADHLAKGIYFYHFEWNDEILDTGKLIVQ